MRKILFTTAICVSVFTFQSCGSSSNSKNTTTENSEVAKADVLESDETEEYLEEPDDAPFEIEAVDLGLSVMWANANIGATSEDDYGCYFAWGESQEKSHYDLDNYFDFQVEASKGRMVRYIYNKFNSAGASLIGTEYDTATKLLGRNWRMPTPEEVQELIDNCEMKQEYVKDQNNHIKLEYTFVTGPNGQSIYFPHGGYKDGNEFNKGFALFWTAYLPTVNPKSGEAMAASTGNFLHDYKMSITKKRRCFGLSVRAVYEDLSNIKIKDGSFKMTGRLGDIMSGSLEMILEGTQVNGKFNNRRVEGTIDEQNTIKLEVYGYSDPDDNVTARMEGSFNGRSFRGKYYDINDEKTYYFSLIIEK